MITVEFKSSFWEPENVDGSKHKKLMLLNPDGPPATFIRGAYLGSAMLPGTPRWGTAIEIVHEDCGRPALVFADPRCVILDLETKDVIYNPREHLSFWGGACPDLFDWLVNHQGWGVRLSEKKKNLDETQL